MGDPAKFLIAIGAAIAAAGILLLILPGIRLGRLPGDIVIKRGAFTVYVPLATGIVLSVLVSLVILLIKKLR